jgi:hypothetical protein
MKIAILVGAALLGTGIAAAPAEAQGYGRYDGYRDRGYRHDYRYDRHDRYDRRDWRGGRGYGWNRGWRGGRGRLVCRVRPSYYGPVRRCFRVYR